MDALSLSRIARLLVLPFSLVLVVSAAVLAQSSADPGDEERLTLILENIAPLVVQGDMEGIWTSLEQAEALARTAFGESSRQYGQYLYTLGQVYDQLGGMEESLEAFRQALDVQRSALGEQHAVVANILNQIGHHYRKLGNYPEALGHFRACAEIQKVDPGPTHPDYANNLRSLGQMLGRVGEYEAAEAMLEEALSATEQIHGPQSKAAAKVLRDMGELYLEMGSMQGFEDYMTRSLAILASVEGEAHPDYLEALHRWADGYAAVNQFGKAEALLQRVRDGYAAAVGTKDRRYADAIADLAQIYWIIGQHEQAERGHGQAYALRRELLGPDAPQTLASMTNQANALMSLGNFAKAEVLLTEARVRCREVLGEQHPGYAIVLNNLANVYMNRKEYAQAERMYEEVQEIRAGLFGRRHSSYARVLVNVANAAILQQDYAKAGPLFHEAEAIIRENNGEASLEYAHHIVNMGTYYMETGSYPRAEEYYRQASALFDQLLGPNHSFQAKVAQNTATLMEKQQRSEETERAFATLFSISHRDLVRSVSFLSQRELQDYNTLFREHSANLLLRLERRLQEGVDPGRLPELAYDDALFRKGFLLSAAQRLQTMIGASPQVDSLYAEWQDIRGYLAHLYTLPLDQRMDDVAALEEEASVMEKALAGQLDGYSQVMRQVRWQDVQAALAPGEAALEFVHYPTADGASEDWHYAALLLRAELAQPQFISLFKESAVSRLFGPAGERPVDFANTLYAWDAAASATGQSLYDLIWRPVEQAGLAGTHTLYVSASGILHRLQLAAIPVGSTQRLADRYQWVTLGSTRQLVEKQTEVPAGPEKSALVLGGLDYGKPRRKEGLTEEELWTSSMADGEEVRGRRWHYLRYTTEEAEKVSRMLMDAGYRTQHWGGMEAEESRIKAMGEPGATSPYIMHLATHGYFFAEPGRQSHEEAESVSVFAQSGNPMIRSGLILSGGNQAWMTGEPEAGEKEDGILTAYEISQLDLSATELVVLSACETALGDILDDEGVYGLQRAFKIAGARYLMMSLWQVPDRPTMEFMTRFYQQWLVDGLSVPQAFHSAQAAMRAQYQDPYLWGAFILME